MDNTPPKLEIESARINGDEVKLTFRAVDSYSPIHRAEYSIDAGDWQMVEPIGEISDAKTENYSVSIPVPPASGDEDAAHAGAGPPEHTIVVRAYDRFDNVGSAKVVVH